MAIVKEIKYSKIPGIYEPEEYTVDVRICDKCGSREISTQGKFLSTWINGVFTIGVLILFYGAIVIGLLTYDLNLCVGIEIISVVVLITFLLLTKFVERNNYYKCDKCGFDHVT